AVPSTSPCVMMRNIEPGLRANGYAWQLHTRTLHVVSALCVSLTPSFRRNEIIGHQLVKPDCSRFRPTKSVNQRKYGCTYIPSSTLAATNVPAMARSIGSRVMTNLLH